MNDHHHYHHYHHDTGVVSVSAGSDTYVLLASRADGVGIFSNGKKEYLKFPNEEGAHLCALSLSLLTLCRSSADCSAIRCFRRQWRSADDRRQEIVCAAA